MIPNHLAGMGIGADESYGRINLVTESRNKFTDRVDDSFQNLAGSGRFNLADMSLKDFDTGRTGKRFAQIDHFKTDRDPYQPEDKIRSPQKTVP